MSKERTEEIILDELNKARQDYHEKASGLSQVESKKYSDKITSLREELQIFLTKGAKPCPKCGNNPTGIHQPTYYEIGCGVCGKNIHSQGFSLKNAVDNWNEETYFEKKK